MRIVVDANVLVSGIFWGGFPGRVLDAWARDLVDLLTSPATLSEYLRVLTDLGGREGRSSLAARWLALMVEHSVPVEVATAVKACRDPDDDKYLACAVDGDADFIVSGDRDLLALGGYRGIPIVTPRQFAEFLRDEGETRHSRLPR